MKRLLFLLFAGLFGQLLVSCYPEGADNVEELDVAITNYDKTADFAAYKTYALPDSIVYFVEKGSSMTANHKFDDAILASVQKHFNALGYEQIAETSMTPPDFIVTVSAFSNVNYYYVDNYWNNGWNWYPGWHWYGWSWNTSFSPYYYWRPVDLYSYRTGSVVIEMLTPQKAMDDNKIPVVWTGIADGLLSGTAASIQSRVEQQINQCFVQSPYLGTK